MAYGKISNVVFKYVENKFLCLSKSMISVIVKVCNIY
jgi:hypothetical protein